MKYKRRLLIEFGDGSPDEYRITDRQVLYRSRRAETSSTWRQLSADDILMHLTLHTVVGEWLMVRVLAGSGSLRLGRVGETLRRWLMQMGPLILCLDENETALRIRRLVLEHAGYRVLFGTDVAGAFSFFAGNPVELVITEDILRDGPAADVIQRMKQLKPEVPIMLLSGAIEWPKIRGVDMFVSKLEPTEDVLEKVASLIGGRTAELPRTA